MYCEKCGRKIEDGALFCDGCGEKINSSGELKKSKPVIYNPDAFKQRAKDAISNYNWLLFSLFLFVASCIISIASFTIIGVLIIYGFLLSFYWISIDLLNGEGVKFDHITTPFKQFKKSLRAIGASLIIGILFAIGFILFVVPGIFIALCYSQTINLIAKEDDIGVFEALRKSRLMMDGHKWELLCFNFSFIGHYLLSLITFGLWAFYLQPYLTVANVVYFQYVYDKYHQNDSVGTDNYQKAPTDKAQS